MRRKSQSLAQKSAAPKLFASIALASALFLVGLAVEKTASAAPGPAGQLSPFPVGTKMVSLTFPAQAVAVLDCTLVGVDKAGKTILFKDKIPARGHIQIPAASEISIIFEYNGLEHLDAFTQLRGLNVNQMNASRLEMEDGQAEVLKQFPNFTRMNFDNTVVTDKILPMLSTFKHLNELRISCTDITGSGFDSLKDLPLTNINFSGINLKPGSLAKIKSMQANTNTINLSRCNVKSADFAYICTCKELLSLDLSGNKTISDSELKDIGNLKKLNFLNVADTAVTAKSLPSLAKLPNLKRLVVRKQQFFPGGVGTSPRKDLAIDDALGASRAPLEVFDPLH